MTRVSLRSCLPLRHAIALGVLQGPTELLPVSSSAHTTAVPLLLGWPYGELDGELRKSFEVALHAGAGFALAIDMRRELLDAARAPGRGRITVIALSIGPPAAAGAAFGGLVERRFGGRAPIALGLAAGGIAMALADAVARPDGRREDDARAHDGLAFGLAQTLALIPGVSRHGSLLTAARARRFARADAQSLSWHAGLPVMLGASALRGLQLARRPMPNALAPLAAGAMSSFLSTLLSARVLRRPAYASRSLLPWAAYRCGLALLLLARGRGASPSTQPRATRA